MKAKVYVETSVLSYLYIAKGCALGILGRRDRGGGRDPAAREFLDLTI